METSSDRTGRAARLTRRAFLGGTASVVASVAALPAEQAMASTKTTKAPPPLTRSTFTPLVNSTFQMIDSLGTSVSVVLASISDLSPVIVANDPNRFSLNFTGPKAKSRPQGIYRFKNTQLGAVNLFAVPVDLVVSARHYQAIINGTT